MGMLDFLFGDAQAAQQPAPPPEPPMPLGAQLNGLDLSVVAPPPKTPEEMQQRKSQWGQFIDKINSDPNLQLAVLRMGTNLMQPVQPGQTAAGHLGRSLDDSVSYLGGLRELETKRKQSERELALKEQKGAADITHTGAQTKQVEQATAHNTQLLPTKLKSLQLELKQLEAQQDTWTPEQAAKSQKLKNDLLQAQIDQAKSHASYYDAAAGVAVGKDTGGRKVQTTKLDDGTLITVTSDKGGTYYTRVVPPKFNTPEEARAAAEQQVKKKTPWFFGKPGYEGTAEQEIGRLTTEWTKPQVQHFDQNNQPLKTLPTEAPAEPTKPLSSREKGMKTAVVMEPGTTLDNNDSVAVLQSVLTDTRKQLAKAKPGSEEHTSLLAAETEILAKLQASTNHGENGLVQGPNGPAVAKGTAPEVIKVERGSDGKLIFAKPIGVDETRGPGLLANAKTTVEAGRLERAKAKLPEVLAKQKAGMTLTTADKAVLALLQME